MLKVFDKAEMVIGSLRCLKPLKTCFEKKKTLEESKLNMSSSILYLECCSLQNASCNKKHFNLSIYIKHISI